MTLYDQEQISWPHIGLVDLRPDPLAPEWRGDEQSCTSSEQHGQHTWWRAPERVEHICPGLHVQQIPFFEDWRFVPLIRRPFDQERDTTYPGDGQRPHQREVYR